MFVFNFKMHKLRCSGKEKTTYVFKIKNVLDFFQSLILYKKIGCSGHVSTLWTTRCMPYDNMMYIIYYFRFDIEYSSGAQQPQRFSRRVALLCAATQHARWILAVLRSVLQFARPFALLFFLSQSILSLFYYYCCFYYYNYYYFNRLFTCIEKYCSAFSLCYIRS